jgi:predicted MPP superfamily phosphohydrolase
MILAITISIYSIIHARNTYIKNVDVSLPNLPLSWQGKKAVWVSDIHLGAIYGKDFSQNIVNEINKTNPDIIFIGGK